MVSLIKSGGFPIHSMIPPQRSLADFLLNLLLPLLFDFNLACWVPSDFLSLSSTLTEAVFLILSTLFPFKGIGILYLLFSQTHPSTFLYSLCILASPSTFSAFSNVNVSQLLPLKGLLSKTKTKTKPLVLCLTLFLLFVPRFQ